MKPDKFDPEALDEALADLVLSAQTARDCFLMGAVPLETMSLSSLQAPEARPIIKMKNSEINEFGHHWTPELAHAARQRHIARAFGILLILLVWVAWFWLFWISEGFDDTGTFLFQVFEIILPIGTIWLACSLWD